MCELFAINARHDVRANRYLREFYEHSRLNPHGWGLAYRSGAVPAHAPAPERIADEAHGDLLRWREPVPAFESRLLPRLLSTPIEATHLLAHIRNATCGTLCTENCHPFLGMDSTGRIWSMVHNGVLFNEGMLWGYECREAGQTDSERTMLFLLDVLDEAALRGTGSLDFDLTFDALAGTITQLGNLNKLNLILDDGTYTYVHTNTDNETLHFRELRDSSGHVDATVFATTPLGGESELAEWRPVPKNRLIAYRHGRLIRASVPHGNVFCDAILSARRALGGVWDPQAGPLKPVMAVTSGN